MIRIFDMIFSFLALLFGLPVLLLIYVILLCESGSPLFTQKRVGRHQVPFLLLKFRTMKTNTIDVATHEVDAAQITPIGHFLRRAKLDELPQLWNVLKGDMSLVGPRPSLLTQLDLIYSRQQHNVFSVRPGITGLAQISRVDMSVPERLAKIDAQMIENYNLSRYFHYIILTVIGQGRGDCIK